MRFRIAAGVLAFTIVAVAGVASASSSGIYGQASKGCGPAASGCHQFGPEELPVSPTTVLLLIDGLPADQFEGFSPGESYTLSVLVVGPVAPLAGFNLEVSGGTLSVGEETLNSVAATAGSILVTLAGGVQVRNDTECDRMQRSARNPQCRKNPDPSKGQVACKVRTICEVFDTSTPDCQCSPGSEFDDPAVCRACEDTAIIDAQATHTAPNVLPAFQVTWTAPNDGTDEVEFWLAGNSVSGDNNTVNDFWNFATTNPTVVHAAE